MQEKGGNITMDRLNYIMSNLAIWAIPLIFAVTVHEAAHGFAASKLGDKTALYLGRVTLNPLKHIDIVGTIIVPLLLLATGGFIFGWAKPVPVDWRNLRNIRRDSALVAVAGPLSNFLMAIFWAMFTKLASLWTTSQLFNFKFFVLMGFFGIQINLMLMVLNLIPIPPLDGSRVLESFLPTNLALKFEAMAPYGLLILVLLIFTGILSVILVPPYMFTLNLINSLFGL